jgi:hypothetical protein
LFAGGSRYQFEDDPPVFIHGDAANLNASRLGGPQGSGPSGHPAKPLVSYQIYRQFSGWIPPPLVIRAFGAHCQDPTFAGPPQTAAVDAKRSATNGEDNPRRNRWASHSEWDGRSSDAFDVYRRTVFGMAARRITERWTALSGPAIANIRLREF